MKHVLKLKLYQPDNVISACNLEKIYPGGTRALAGINLCVSDDDFIAVIGSSGAGKSTFLRCLNRLENPTSGTVHLHGENITKVSGSDLKQVRRKVGMIFQQFNLVRRLSVLENVLVGRLRFNISFSRLGMSVLKFFPKSEKAVAFECLQQVGIEELAFQRADRLSGGQQQRVAIARTLAQEPDVILADEPIASLDPGSAETVMDILRNIHGNRGIPILVNLHHIDFARSYAKRIVGMKKGMIVFDGTPDELDGENIAGIYGANISEAHISSAAVALP